MGLLNRLVFLLGKLIKELFPSAKEDGAKIIIGHDNGADELYPGTERRKHVRFPVSLSVLHGQELPLKYQDFVLNASEGGIFIQCDSPFPPETILVLHFYIPPDERLLAEFNGEVTEISNGSKYAVGMHVKLFPNSDEDMKRFLSYLEERRHLLDIKT